MGQLYKKFHGRLYADYKSFQAEHYFLIVGIADQIDASSCLWPGSSKFSLDARDTTACKSHTSPVDFLPQLLQVLQ